MIKIKFIVIGSLKEDYLVKMEKEYLKRLSKYASVNITEFKETPFEANKLTKETINKIVSLEDKKILEKINKEDVLILLDLKGKSLTSEEFSFKLNDYISNLRGDIVISIGGPLGVSEALRNRANLRLKLSDLTFTHQITRILILEQLYRAFKIINHENYHY